jgi:hypothetical protein
MYLLFYNYLIYLPPLPSSPPPRASVNPTDIDSPPSASALARRSATSPLYSTLKRRCTVNYKSLGPGAACRERANRLIDGGQTTTLRKRAVDRFRQHSTLQITLISFIQGHSRHETMHLGGAGVPVVIISRCERCLPSSDHRPIFTRKRPMSLPVSPPNFQECKSRSAIT